MNTDIVVVANLPKVGEVKELRLSGLQMVHDDEFPEKAKMFSSILKQLAEDGRIEYVIYDDIATMDKVIKIKRLKL